MHGEMRLITIRHLVYFVSIDRQFFDAKRLLT